MKPLCYYSHPTDTFGTPQEKADIKSLQGLGLKVVGPHEPEYRERFADEGLQMLLDIVQACQVLAFRAEPNGHIGTQTAAEITAAREKGLPVVELPSLDGRL